MGVLNYNGALYLATGIDNSGLRRDASEAESIIEGLGKTAQSVGTMMGVAFTLDAAKNLIGQIVNIRGEFQKLETAFGVLLQSKEKASAMMREAVELAGTTPFSLQGVASGSKQLLAYGFEAKDITGTLRMLGDVAAGLGLPLERLTYLYGTTLTQGRLMSRDLMQFTTSGIPLLQELADQFGVTTKEVQALVEEGRVGFPEVQKAFEAMTGAGGKFHGMMEEMSKTVTGQVEKLKDAIDVMFNEIGKSQEGVIYKAIDGASSLVENYKAVGSALADIVVAYGAYKGAMMVMEAGRQVVQGAQYAEEAKQLQDLLSAEQQAALSKQGLSKYSAEYVSAVKTEVAANVEAAKEALNKARAEVVAANQTLASKRQEYIEAKNLEATRTSELASIKAAGTAKKIEAAERNLATAATKKEAAAAAFMSAQREFNARKVAVETAAKQANTVATAANTTAQNANVTVLQRMGSISGAVASKLGQLASALAPSLYVAAAAAMIAIGQALYEIYSKGSAAEQAMNAINEAARRAAEDINTETSKVETLVKVLESETATRDMKEKALQDLHALYPSILGDLKQEDFLTGQATESIKRYIQVRAQQIQLDKLAQQQAEAQSRLDAAKRGDGVSWNQKLLFTAQEALLGASIGIFALAGKKPMELNTIDKRVNARIEAANAKEATAAKATLDEVDKKIEEIINQPPKNVGTAVKNIQDKLAGLGKWTVTNTNDTVDQVVAKIETAKKKLASQRKMAQNGLIDVKDIEETEGQIDELEKKYQKMTGEKYDQSKAAAAAAKRHIKELAKEQKEKAEAMAEIEELTRSARKRIEDADLEMMNEGLEKKLQKIDLDYQRELQEIEEWKKKLEKANKTLTGKEALTEDQQAYYEASKAAMDQKNMKARANATNEWKRKEAEAYDEMLQAFGNYKEKEAAIAREYARKIADAEREGRTNEAERLKREEMQKQASAAESELGKDDTLKTFFKHTEKQTLQTAKKVRIEIANTIKYLKTKGEEGTVDAEKAKLLQRMLGDPELVRQTLEGLETDLEKVDDTIEGIQHQKVFDALIANFKKLRKAAAGSQEQMSALNGVTGGLSTIGGMITQLGNAMADCDVNAGKVVVTVGNAITSIASFAAAGASVGGVWGAIAGAVVGAASAIIPAIGKIDEWSQSLEKSYDSQLKWLDKARDANIELIKGYGSVAEKIDLATKAIENNVKALELLNQKSRELREYQSEDKNGHSVWYMDRQKVATTMRDMGAFENYDEWEKTYVPDAKKRYEYNKYVRNPKNVHATQGVPLLLEAMKNGYVPIKIKAEFDKQGLDLQKFLDDPAGYLTNTKEGALNYEQMKWLQDTYPALLAALDSRQRELVEQRMEHLKAESEKVTQALQESMAGVSFDGLLSEYESFLKKAGDGSKDLGKTIEGHLRDAIVKGLIDKKTEERIKKAYERIANLMQNREKMSAEEYQKQLQEAKDELTQIYKELAEKKKEAFDKTGLKDYEETKENSMRGALAKASQESIDLLAGVMGAIRVSIEQIVRLMNESRGKGGGVAEYYDSIRQSFAALREIQIAGWKEVTAIKDMVQQIHVTQVTVAQLSQTVADHTASIKETSRRMAESITAINNSGVKIKGGGLGL